MIEVYVINYNQPMIMLLSDIIKMGSTLFYGATRYMYLL